MIEYEASTIAGTTYTDEQYAYIEGAFGQIQAGQKNGVSSQLAHFAPSVGLSQADVDDWTSQSSQLDGTLDMANVDTTWSSDDAAVTYITPSMAGFSAGVTFKPNPGGAGFANTKQAAGTTDFHNQWQAAIAYNGDLSGVGIGVDVGYAHQSADDVVGGTDGEDETAWRAGLVVAYSGFQVGGSYKAVKDVSGVKDRDRDVWDVGVAYKAGPYGVSLTYANNTYDLENSSQEPEYQQVHLGASYAMGPGHRSGWRRLLGRLRR